MCDFVHLHNHTKFSTLDGVITKEWLFPRLKELGMSSFAITDHGSMSGIPEFSSAGTKHGVKIIAGIEIYEVDNIEYKTAEERLAGQESCDLETRTKSEEREDKAEVLGKSEAKYWHLTMLAKNIEGYRQLVKLAAAANTKAAFYYKPRIDRKMLQEIVKGGNIIIGTGCALSRISRYALDKEDYSGFSDRIDGYARIFGIDNIMCEIMANGYDKQGEINEKLISWANKKGVPIVATNDCLGGDTIVYTEHGAKTLDTIQVGDKVLTHKGRYKTVLAVCEKMSDKVKYKITSSNSQVKNTKNHLIATEDHKWYVHNTNTGKFEWVMTKNLQPVHETFIPKIQDTTHTRCKSVNFAEHHVSDQIIRNIDADFCYLLGLFCGDGHAAKHTNSWSLCINKSNQHAIDLVAKFLSTFGLFNVVNKYKDIVTIRLNNRYLSRWFRYHCYNNDVKKIPDLIHGLNPIEQSAFVNGLMDADGHCNEYIYSFDNTSLDLVAGFSQIMHLHGVYNTIRQSQIEQKQYRNGWLSCTSKQYNWSSKRSQIEKITTFLGIYKHNMNIVKHNGKLIKSFREDERGVFLQIKKEVIEYNDSVFDIQVEDDASFVTNFGTVHNCHYVNKSDAPLQDILLCIATRQYVHDEGRKFKFEGTSYYVRTPEEMADAFKQQYDIDVVSPGWLSNTLHFAEMCEHSGYINDPQFRLPKFEIKPDPSFINWIKTNKGRLSEHGFDTEALISQLVR